MINNISSSTFSFPDNDLNKCAPSSNGHLWTFYTSSLSNMPIEVGANPRFFIECLCYGSFYYVQKIYICSGTHVGEIFERIGLGSGTNISWKEWKEL